MTWHFDEVVCSGNSQARVKNYYPETGLLVLCDIQGVIEKGMTIVGDDSGTSLTLSNFQIAYEYDMGYEPTQWEEIFDNAICDDSGRLVALEDHFTGKPSQEYQTTYIVVNG